MLPVPCPQKIIVSLLDILLWEHSNHGEKMATKECNAIVVH